MSKKIIFDDSCSFCIATTKRVFGKDYQLIGSSQLSTKDNSLIKDINLKKEIVLIDEKGHILRNVDVFLDAKKDNKLLFNMAKLAPVHYCLRQIYKLVATIRYKLK